METVHTYNLEIFFNKLLNIQFIEHMISLQWKYDWYLVWNSVYTEVKQIPGPNISDIWDTTFQDTVSNAHVRYQKIGLAKRPFLLVLYEKISVFFRGPIKS